ncbi:MAG TPA: TolC family protein [Pyrinomonadaceae bacterium]
MSALLLLCFVAQSSAQIKERIASETPVKPPKKTKAEKKAEKAAKTAKKNKNKSPVTSVASALVMPAPTTNFSGVDLADGLTEIEAVQLALWNNAQFNADLSQIGFARADLKEAGLLRNPIFSLLFPIGPRQIEAAFSLPIEILWQRPKRVAAAKLNVERVAQSLEQNGLNLVRDVRLGYAELALAQERTRLTINAADTRRQIPSIMEARFHIGDISEAEMQTARADWQAFEEDRTRFEREAGAVKERLRLLIGLSAEQTAFEIAPAVYKPVKFTDTDALIVEARATRPDVRAAELAIEAAGARAKVEKSKIYTFLARLEVKSGTVYPAFTSELPILNRNQGGIARAYAELDAAMRQYAVLQEQIAAEIREAQIRLGKSEELIAQLRRDVIPTLEREQQIQQTTFERGDIPFLFVLQNRQRLDLARIREAEAVAEMRRAQILLDRSVGKNSSEQ